MLISNAFPTGAAPRRSAWRFAAAGALALVAGCGGGGGGGSPPPAPVNQAPTFTSGTSVAIVENTGSTIYRATATDPEGTAVVFSIVGGADAARFLMAPNGELSMVVPPNFDLPTDSDLNNVYLVEIGAGDGVNRTNQTIAVTVSNSKEGVSVRRIATGFVNPVSISARDETSLLVAEKGGAIYSLDLQSGARQLLAQIPFVNGQGVLSVTANDAAGPDLSFFVMYMSNGVLVVWEYRRITSPSGPYHQSNFGPVLSIPAPNYTGGGWLGFDFQNRLLIATGDEGGNGGPTGSAQSDSSRFGKIIRATPNPDPFAGASPSLYLFTNIAKGLHQPVGGFAYQGGLFIGDRGQTVADEVDFLAANQSGLNFGWPFKEGFQTVQGTPPADAVDPLTAYARVATTPQGIVGGAIAGSNISPIASLAGHYIFADRSGAIFGFPTLPSLQNARTTTERRTADFAPDAGAIDQPVAVIADRNGRLYILDGDGDIFRVEGS
ncbi:MAG TPA: PQQ-dependent sugar dehydrogenase [Allosphingosinicella sp.]|nr:PQQ-dependent sugar dehydrogenase [Allosphingosinicella sp.]